MIIAGMFQVRVVCQDQLTERLVEAVTGDPGVLNVVVHPARAVRPAGDAVQFDVADSSANRVLRQLRELGAAEYAPVAVQVVDVTSPPPRRPAGWLRPHFGEAAPVWDLVRARIQADAVYAPSFFLLLIIAGLIAAVGILTNSQILIVAAMVVGPEYGAIISVAAGAQSREWRPVREGLIALTVGFVLAIVVTLFFAWCIKTLGRTPQAFERGVRPVSDLIDTPNLFSVVVAVLAGIVGVVSLAESRANALIGVFISITTIPAAADVGVSMAYHQWAEAGGSVLQLLLNVGLLIIVGALALGFTRYTWRGMDAPVRRPRP